MAVSRISSSSDDYESLHEVTHRPVKAGFRKKTWLIRGIGLSVLLGLFLATSLTIGRKDNLHKILLWLSEHRAGGFVIFALLYIWFTVLFLPPALLAACAGAIYGFLVAIPLVWFCAVLGETVSFLLGRFLLKKWVAELTADWPMWTALNAALKEDGWKLVALLRVSPVVPFSLLNYALGSSSLPVSTRGWMLCCQPDYMLAADAALARSIVCLHAAQKWPTCSRSYGELWNGNRRLGLAQYIELPAAAC
eukprot:GHUV01020600.1.p1 GENE.GHUV01020600.1~~GHUV01020600.1.p1  ORF type:complete len:250 (+),score=50.84 GHUV01020600.1:667-1416(+)